MVERVDGGDDVAGRVVRTAANANARQFPRVVVRGDEARDRADITVSCASGADVDVAHRSQANPFVQRPEAAGRDRRHDRAVAHRAYRGAFVDSYVHAGMEALAARGAARLADGAGNLVRPVHRRDRPQQRRAGERILVEAWSGERRPRQLRARPGDGGHGTHVGVAGVRDDEPPGSPRGHSCQPAEMRVAAAAVAKSDAGPGNRPRPAGAVDLDDAPTFIADVEGAVIAADNRHRPHERTVRLARESRHDTAGLDAAHGPVAGVGDMDVAADVHAHSAGRIEARIARQTVVRARRRTAGDRGDAAVGRDCADAIVVGIGDDHPAGAVDGNTDGPVESCARSVGVAGGAIAGERGDRAVRRDPPHRVIAAVRDVQHPSRVEGNRRGCVELRCCRRAVPKPAHAAGECLDATVDRDPAHAVRSTVGHVDDAVQPDGDTEGLDEPRSRQGPVGVRVPSLPAIVRTTAAQLASSRSGCRAAARHQKKAHPGSSPHHERGGGGDQ